MVVKLWLSLTKLTRKLFPTGSAGLGERTVNVLVVPSTRAARTCCTDESCETRENEFGCEEGDGSNRTAHLSIDED